MSRFHRHYKAKEVMDRIKQMILDGKIMSDLSREELADFVDDLDYMPRFFAVEVANEIQRRLVQ